MNEEQLHRVSCSSPGARALFGQKPQRTPKLGDYPRASRAEKPPRALCTATPSFPSPLHVSVTLSGDPEQTSSLSIRREGNVKISVRNAKLIG